MATSAQAAPSWPRCLNMLSEDTCMYDLECYNELLSKHERRVFSPPGEDFAIKIWDWSGSNVKSFLVSNIGELQGNLEQWHSPGPRIVMIQQFSSVGRLAISVEGMKCLMTRLQAFAPCIDLLTAFGVKSGQEDETSNLFRYWTDPNAGRKHMTYAAKFVEEHGRMDIEEPWSLRKCGLYQHTSLELGDCFIVLNPSPAVQIKFRNLSSCRAAPSSAQIHLSILSTVVTNWRWCISDYEKRCSDMAERAQLERIERIAQQEKKDTGSLAYRDVQSIQHLQDGLEKLHHALGIDVDLLSSIPKHLSLSNELFHELQNVAVSERSRISTVLKRLTSTTDLVARILDFKCLRGVEESGEAMAKLGEMTNRESALIVLLSRKASRDADQVKTLTLVALVYLPLSFTASMMSMQYISVDSSSSTLALDFRSEFWVYLCITAIFLVVTLAVYYVWWYKRRRGWKLESTDWSTGP